MPGVTGDGAKGIYTSAVRGVRNCLGDTAALGRLDAWAGRSTHGRWVRSLLAIHDAQDLAALDMPWWTLRAAQIVNAFLASRPAPRVFEWGSGASTVWLGRRAAEVVSVEHDPAWAKVMRSMVGPEVRLRVVEPSVPLGVCGIRSARRGYEGLDFSDYVAAINDESDPFDLIVIDGRAREACLASAIGRMRRPGMILLDNVERRRYRVAIQSCTRGIPVRWTMGATPCLPYPTATALIGSPDG